MSNFQLPMELPRTEIALKDINSKNPMARYAAAVSLAVSDDNFSSQSIEALFKASDDPFEEIRAQVVEGLAEWRLRNFELDSNKIAKLKSLLKDESPQVRSSVISNSALFFTDYHEFILNGVNDKEQGVRACAADQLSGFSDEKSLDALKNLLTDSDKEVSLRAAIAMGKDASADAIMILVNFISHPGSYYIYITDAVVTLALAKNDIAKDALYKKATGFFASSDVRAICCAALLRFENPLQLDPALKLLKSYSRKTRTSILQALFRLPHTSIGKNVAEIINNSNSDMEKSLGIEVLKAIKEIDCDKGMELLQTVKDGLEGDILLEWEAVYNEGVNAVNE
ncbi:MAG: HEAT repeat domain-containing protein [Deltaproteobacteria bacterium]|nr:HEAT repeat domain-containing protein [Deltaproteobacteria bacterium]